MSQHSFTHTLERDSGDLEVEVTYDLEGYYYPARGPSFAGPAEPAEYPEVASWEVRDGLGYPVPLSKVEADEVEAAAFAAAEAAGEMHRRRGYA
jgi:hypothetical protein